MKQIFEVPEGCKKVSIEIIPVFEPKHNFKEGDIIYWSGFHSGLGIILGKCKSFPDDSYSAFLLSTMKSDNQSLNYKNIRLTTKEEKQTLFDALAKAGKKWNPITLKVEDLKVEPKVGDCVKAKYASGSVYLGVFNGSETCWKLGLNREISKGCFKRYESIQILTKSLFQSEVNALGFEYDFDTDKFNEFKWKPKEGERYFCFDSELLLNETNNDGVIPDKNRIMMFNCFKTKAECESAIEKIKKLLK